MRVIVDFNVCESNAVCMSSAPELPWPSSR
jgi:ferredoxin